MTIGKILAAIWSLIQLAGICAVVYCVFIEPIREFNRRQKAIAEIAKEYKEYKDGKVSNARRADS